MVGTSLQVLQNCAFSEKGREEISKKIEKLTKLVEVNHPLMLHSQVLSIMKNLCFDEKISIKICSFVYNFLVNLIPIYLTKDSELSKCLDCIYFLCLQDVNRETVFLLFNPQFFEKVLSSSQNESILDICQKILSLFR